MAYCAECGNDVIEKAKFCPHCGTPQQDISKKSTDESGSATVKSTTPPLYGAVALDRLPEGFVINKRYEVKEKLGQGGFAAVYRVFDKSIEIEKALKVFIEAFSNDKEAVDDLRREGKIMMNLTYDRIVRIYDVHTEGAIKYIDMEYVDGKPLSDYKLDFPDRKVPEEKVLDIAAQLVEGLSYAHGKRVIHKDIKPQNILITSDGELKISDFGISDCIRSSMSRVANTTSSGTLAYMAPEQIRGENVGVEADIYGFGILLYELLSGRPPFYQGDLHYQIFNNKPQRITGVSDNTNDMLSKCLEKDYNYRYPSFGVLGTTINGNASDSSGQKGRVDDYAHEIVQKKANGHTIETTNEIGEKSKSESDTITKKPKTSVLKKTVIGILVLVAGFFALIYLGEYLDNYTFNEQMYTISHTKLHGYWQEGTVVGYEFVIDNNSNSFEIKSINIKVDIYETNSNKRINGFTFTERVTVPANSTRNISNTRAATWPYVSGLPPSTDKWYWRYEAEVKGTFF